MNKYIYSSCFENKIIDYLEQRTRNGFKSTDTEYMMHRFDRFLIQENYDSQILSRDIIDKWSIQLPTENKKTRNKRVSSVRQFSRYLISIGIEAYISKSQSSEPKTLPYILSYEELERLFLVVDTFEANSVAKYYHYNYMIPIIFRLCYCCGLRNSEVRLLKHEQIIHDKKALLIIDTKNKENRIVYIDNGVYDLLMKYVEIIRKIQPSEWLFPTDDSNKAIAKTQICRYCNKIVTKAKIGNKHFHPTLHSLRHTYVVHKVDEWINSNGDINNLIPYLSKQLGHSSIQETYYYYHTIETSLKAIRNKDKYRAIYPEVTSYEE